MFGLAVGTHDHFHQVNPLVGYEHHLIGVVAPLTLFEKTAPIYKKEDTLLTVQNM